MSDFYMKLDQMYPKVGEGRHGALVAKYMRRVGMCVRSNVVCYPTTFDSYLLCLKEQQFLSLAYQLSSICPILSATGPTQCMYFTNINSTSESTISSFQDTSYKNAN